MPDMFTPLTDVSTGSISGISAKGNKIGDIADPTMSADATNKAYVDRLAQTNIATYTLANPFVRDVDTTEGDLGRFVVLPNATKLFVSHYAGIVSVINLTTNLLVTNISVGNGVLALCLNSNATKLYVANGEDDTVSVINTTTNLVTATISVGDRPGGLCLSTDGTKLFVANYDGGTVSVINTATEAVDDTIATGGNPEWMIVRADRLYVTDAPNDTLHYINTTTNAIVTTVTVANCSTIVRNPAGTLAFIAQHDLNAIKVLDIVPTSPTFNTVLATIAVGNGPYQVVVSPNGLFAFTVCGVDGTVDTVNLTSNTLVGKVAIAGGGSNFQGLGVNPAGTRVFVSHDNTSNVAFLDASMLTSPSSPVISPASNIHIALIDNGIVSATVNLPAPSDCDDGKERIVKRLGTALVTIDGNGALIDNSSSDVALASQNAVARFAADSTKWWKTS